MLKYTQKQVVFQEIPNEVSLCFVLSGCPNRCVGCHSAYLRDDLGEELTKDIIKNSISGASYLTSVLLFGGDNDIKARNDLGRFIRSLGLKSSMYSGNSVDTIVNYSVHDFDYVKLGPYIKEFGPINNKNTNQRLFKSNGKFFEDITSIFYSPRN